MIGGSWADHVWFLAIAGDIASPRTEDPLPLQYGRGFNLRPSTLTAASAGSWKSLLQGSLPILHDEGEKP